MKTRLCNYCKQTKLKTDFYNGCKCKECHKEWHKEYRRNYRERARQGHHDWQHGDDLECIHCGLIKSPNNFKTKSVCYSCFTQQSRTNRKKWVDQNRERYNKYLSNKRDNPRWKIDNLLYKALLHARHSYIQNKKSKNANIKNFDFTRDELCHHIESLFANGMSWENMGEWELDHIIPVNHFDYESVDSEDFKKCWSLDNLQPLWKKDNKVKGSG